MGTGQELDVLLEGLRAEDLDLLCDEELAAALVDLRKQIDWLEAEWARRLAAFDEVDGRQLEGHTSTTAFLKHRCQMSAGRAQRAITLSQRLSSIPHTEKAFTSGEVSLDQVRLVTAIPERLGSDLARDEVSLVNGLAGLSVAIAADSSTIGRPRSTGRP